MKSTWPGVSIRLSWWPFQVHAHRLRLDRDPALALEIHRVEHLLAHLALRDGVGELEDAVGERRLAVVDVRDDREVADAVWSMAREATARSAVRRFGTRRRTATIRSALRARDSALELTSGRAPGRARRRRRQRRRGRRPARAICAERATAPSAASSPHQRRTPTPGRDAPTRPRRADDEPTVARRARAPRRRRSITSSATVADDVDHRGRERDPPDAEAVEDGVEPAFSARFAERDAGRDPVRLQAEERRG